MRRYTLVRIGNSPNWFVQWFEAGHSRRVSTRERGRREAEAFLRAFELEREENPLSGVTLDQILNWYVATRGPHIATRDDAERAVRQLTGFFGLSLPAENVSIARQAAFVRHREQSVSRESIRRELSVLSAALKLAERHDKIERAPAILSLPKAPARERYLTRDEVAKLWRELRRSKRTRHLLLFARLALATGARSGAILDLTWDRVDLARGLVWYPLPGRIQSNKRRAVVPLEPPVVRMLSMAKKRATGAHVIEWRGEGVGRVLRAFTRHAKAVGLDDVTPHTLRHTFATWAAQAGVPMFQIGGALGQSVAATTERYAKHNPEGLRAVTRAVRRK